MPNLKYKIPNTKYIILILLLILTSCGANAYLRTPLPKLFIPPTPMPLEDLVPADTPNAPNGNPDLARSRAILGQMLEILNDDDTLSHDYYDAYANLLHHDRIDGQESTDLLTRSEIESLLSTSSSTSTSTTTKLSDLTDLNLTGLAGDKILKYQSSTGQWVIADDNNSGSGGGGTTYSSGNGLSLSDTTFNLGGTLSSDVTYTTAGYNTLLTGTGKLGIGTATPTAFLDLPASTTAAASLRIRTGTQPTSGNTGDLYSDGTNLYYYNGSSWDDLTDAGSGGVTADSLDFTDFADAMTLDASTSINLYDGATDRTLRFHNSDASQDLLFLDGSTGYVGIGTTSPDSGLQVKNSANTSFKISSDDGDDLFSIADNGHAYLYRNPNINGRYLELWYGNINTIGSGALNLLVENTNVLRLVNNGPSYFNNTTALGIGTTAPSYTLDVAGSARTQQYELFTSAGQRRAHLGTTGTNSQLLLGNNNGSWTTRIHSNDASYFNGGSLGIGTTSPSTLLDVNGTAWLRGTGTSGLYVNSSGNVGIGTTSPDRIFAINQNEDNKGIRINGYDDVSSSYFDLHVSNGGAAVISASGDIYQNRSTYFTSGTYTPAIMAEEASTTNPIFTFRTDTDTGIGHGTANQLALITGGVNQMLIDANGLVGIGTTAPTAKLDLLDTSNTAATLSLTNNTATTLGAGTNTLGLVDWQSTSLTTGNFLNLETNALTSGKGINLTSTSAALTTGSLFSGYWNPTGSTEIYSTGDLFKIDVGQYANPLNLFALYDNGSELFSVDQTKITANVPVEFNAAGDVSIANDLAFTNDTQSNITSSGPLYIKSGQAFESNDLTLSTYNSGNIYLDLTGTGHAQLIGTDTSLVFDTRTATDTDYWIGITDDAGGDDDDLFQIGDGLTPGTNPFLTINTTGNVGIGTTSPTQLLQLYGTNPSLLINPSANTQTASLLLTAMDGTTRGGFTTNIATGEIKIGAINPSASGYFPTLYSNGSERMRINTTGSVGIGTTSPTTLLSLGDTSTYTFVSSGLSLGDGDTGLYESADDKLNLRTAGSDRLTIDSSGNIGIGTTNPSYALDLQAGTNGRWMLQGGTGGNTATIGVSTNGGASNNYSVYIPNYLAIGYTPTSGSGPLWAHTAQLGVRGKSIFQLGASDYLAVTDQSSSAGSDLLRVTSSGLVGIGTTAPAFPLDVATSISSTQSYGFLNSSGAVGTSSGTTNYSIRASDRILASEFNAVSDARLKDVQFDLNPAIALDAITQLNPVSFTWKNNPTGQPMLGFLAQDVETIIPNAVSRIATENYPDQRELNYNQLTAVTIAALQQLNTKIDNLASTSLSSQERSMSEAIGSEVPTNLENLKSMISDVISDHILSQQLHVSPADLAKELHATITDDYAVLSQPIALLDDLLLDGDLSVFGDTQLADTTINGTLILTCPDQPISPQPTNEPTCTPNTTLMLTPNELLTTADSLDILAQTISLNGVLTITQDGNVEIAGDLTVNGQTNLADTTIDGTLTFTDEATPSATPNPEATSTATLTTISSSSITTPQLIISDNTAGTLTLPAGQTTITLQFTTPYQTTPTVIASPLEHYIPHTLKNITKDSFTLNIQNPQTQDLQFTYITIGTTNN